METAKGKTREEIINRLADRIDSFERYSQPHSKLMAELATHLAHRMGLAESDISAVAEAALLHDIGMYAMSPAYCHSPGALSFQERLDLWRHPVIGEQQMAKREANRHAQLLVRWHHEWWNGSGYPDALGFEDIPIGARILRAVEFYSAITSDRPYRLALTDEAAVEALRGAAGIECDPQVVKALTDLLEELRSQHECELNEMRRAAETAAAALPVTGNGPGNFPAVLEPGPPVPTQDPWQAPAEQPPRDPWVLSGEANEPARPELELPVPDEPTAQLLPVPVDQIPIQPVQPEQSASGAIHKIPVLELLSRIEQRSSLEHKRERYGWRGSRYNGKVLLGFEASVLSQIEFRSVAIPFTGSSKLALYLKNWGKLILANDQRAWAAAVAHSLVQARVLLGEDHITRVLHDVYVPGVRLNNAGLRRWFGETDAWWMDNLRQNIDSLEDESMRAQALTIGLQAGDYALSFDDQTRDLRMPLTTVYWRLAGRAVVGPATNPHSQSFNLPAEEFIKQARTDLLFLSVPPAQSERAGAEARSEWREQWVRGSTGSDSSGVPSLAEVQSRHSYLAGVDRLLRLGSQIKTWAIGCQDTGLSSCQDLVELIKEYRPVRATYSKDLTEVAGGLRSCIVVADRPVKSR